VDACKQRQEVGPGPGSGATCGRARAVRRLTRSSARRSPPPCSCGTASRACASSASTPSSRGTARRSGRSGGRRSSAAVAPRSSSRCPR